MTISVNTPERCWSRSCSGPAGWASPVWCCTRGRRGSVVTGWWPKLGVARPSRRRWTMPARARPACWWRGRRVPEGSSAPRRWSWRGWSMRARETGWGCAWTWPTCGPLATISAEMASVGSSTRSERRGTARPPISGMATTRPRSSGATATVMRHPARASLARTSSGGSWPTSGPCGHRSSSRSHPATTTSLSAKHSPASGVGPSPARPVYSSQLADRS